MNRRNKKLLLINILCVLVLLSLWLHSGLGSNEDMTSLIEQDGDNSVLYQKLRSPTREEGGSRLHQSSTYVKRKHMLQEFCSNHTECYKRRTCQFTQHFSMIVHDKYKVMWCDNAKVGSTTIKWKIASLSGKTVPREGIIHQPEELKRYGLTYLSDYNDAERQYRIDNYFKFMFVRHPFVRVVGAYLDKFIRGRPPYAEPWVNQQLKMIRRDKATLQKRDLEFPEFLWLITHTEMRNDVHWISFVDKCMPCHLQYDFIGKLETFTEDFNLIMKDLFNASANLDDRSAFGREHSINATKDKAKSYISTLNQEGKNILHDRFFSDAQMFGYSVEGLGLSPPKKIVKFLKRRKGPAVI